MNKPKVLLYDIETAPSLGYFYDLWKEGNIVATKVGWYVLCIAYQWLDENKVHSIALPDFKGYKPGSEDDKELIKDFWKLVDEADVTVAHNGDKFDNRKIKARFIYHKLQPPSPYKTIDTYKEAKKFGFQSNKLDYLGDHLGHGRKRIHTGFELWRGCMSGDPKSWKEMVAYNKRDVSLLKSVYLDLRPWITNHPNTAILSAQEGCPNCSSTHLQKRGFGLSKTGTHQRFQCQKCRAWSHGPSQKVTSITN